MATPEIRISRERKELLSLYATAAVFLYGVISIDEFVEVFNHYEEAHTTAEEVLLGLKRLARTDDVEYSLSRDILSAPEFQPEFDDYEDNVRSLRASQRGKPRYLPEKEEFLRYIENAHREPEEPWADLRAYILRNGLGSGLEGLDGVDGDLMDMHEMIQFGVRLSDVFEYFIEAGYKFKTWDDFSAFAQLVISAHNNTRMYEINGHTPQELLEAERPKLRPLPNQLLNFYATLIVDRNDLCPCGSGLKYKKCHGSN